MSLRQKATSGVKWTTVSTLISIGLQVGRVPILTRLLSPEDFGLMAMVMIVLGFAQTYADMGISSAIIFRQDASPAQLSSLYWLNVLSGIAVCAFVVLLTPLVVAFYGEPRLMGLLPLVALVFVITPLGQQFQVLLQRELLFKELASIEVAGAVVGTAIAVTAALGGQGVRALVWGQIGTTLVTAGLFAFIGWRRWPPGFHFRRRDLEGFVGFGLYQMGERTANYLTQQLDQLIIGSLVGVRGLGYYNVSMNLVLQPIARVNPILTRVAFPVFARLQTDRAQLLRLYMSIRRIVAFVSAPALLGMIAIAPSFVPLVLGPQWAPATPLVQILSLVALLRSLGNPVGSLLLATGRADLGFKWTLLVLSIQVPGIVLGALFGGVLGVALVLVALTLLYTVMEYPFLIRTCLGPCLRLHLRSVMPQIVCAGGMALGVWWLGLSLPLSPVARLGVQIVAGGAAYLALIAAFQRQEIRELLALVRGRAGEIGPSPSGTTDASGLLQTRRKPGPES